MIYFKACPKCHGDMLSERDYTGEYRHCLQCGLLEDLAPEPVRRAVVEAAKRVA